MSWQSEHDLPMINGWCPSKREYLLLRMRPWGESWSSCSINASCVATPYRCG